ncbi:23S rRNA (uracil(1939)-C(5))-methyltransferase RlmD [Flavobacteriaceae bacterium]|jgi:23S rRNA (uracil1939-C5)-methyltransferase|nr:23S rRNA (uracil(1939)-C(5))-methyltransferase RlmD [Bacteroidota bacterium]MDB2471260.1 23S rRNA (uracil(1939)-C(5))-methyltransferase RlmD [Flavobacteriaceae bacterium]MDC0957752.1 23S rRNA (uracil(1939)-C(5))-methyltransferase RlmD [Flavobacteriaceae bacterium]MDC1052205.1 23S rRNA (uracil(1939)-C(5))-methyltransferase RlmD [Flavobacteriaceae bacterium]MDC3242146.1 23S rRNA (uracil(1939)-C(5))-methyltransferase RlmD [Flavobacteriaceae bacterium]
MSRKNRKQIFTNIDIIDAGAKGKVIGKAPDGKVIFLSNAVPGDIVDVQTFKKRKAYYEGKAIKFIKLSEKRTSPKCEHFGTCGGCKWQHMDYEQQLYYKEKEVVNNLSRIGHLKLPKVTPILGSEQHYFYRNKMEFSFSDSRWLTPDEINSNEDITDKNALGFHIPGMWDKILDIKTCYLQGHSSNDIRNSVKKFAIDNNLKFFNPRNQSGFLRTLMIRTSSIGEIMVVLQFFKDDKSQRELILRHIASDFPNINSLQYVINQKGNDTIYDQQVHCFKGRDFILEKMEGLTFKINAKSFYQTNSQQAYELYKITRNFAGLTGKELVYDLYTGTGTIAQFVAKNAKKVIGIEAVPEAIEAAKENALFNQIDNVEFHVGDMKTIFNSQFIESHGRPDVLITDPPRDGMHKNVVSQILNIAPNKIVYVSCNSATQARDLALMDLEYEISKTQSVDMFPQTHHVENVVLLTKR